MTNRQARKGAKGENEVIAIFHDAGFLQAQRTRAGAEDDRGDVASIPNLTVEVKNWTDFLAAVDCALRELVAEQANNRTRFGVAAIKRARKGWVAVMPLPDFAALYAAAHGVSPPDESQRS